MSISILRIKDFGFDINNFLREILDKEKNYSKNFDYVESRRLIYCDGFKREMNFQGISCVEIIANNFFLQSKWCYEKNIKFDESRWYNDILQIQINYYNPKILFFEGNIYLDFDILKKLKSKKNLKVVIRSGLPLKKIQKNFCDIIFASTPCLNNLYRKEKLNSFLLYNYFDKQILKEIKIKDFDVRNNNPVFVGSSGYNSSNKLSKRYFFLKNLIKKTDLVCFLYEGNKSPFIKSLYSKIKYQTKYAVFFLSKSLDIFLRKFIFYNKFISKRKIYMNKNYLYPNFKDYFNKPKKPLSEIFPNKVNSPKFGIDLYNKISDHKIFINKHVDDIFSAGNLKMFESTGVKTALFVEKFDNLNDNFVENEEVVFYLNQDDLEKKIKFFLENQDKLAEIANRGHEKTLKHHSTKNRIKEILEVLNN